MGATLKLSKNSEMLRMLRLCYCLLHVDSDNLGAQSSGLSIQTQCRYGYAYRTRAPSARVVEIRCDDLVLVRAEEEPTALKLDV
jgi:hypothetical protein